MRRNFAARHPQLDNPVKTLADYTSEDRGALMKAVETAITLTEPRTDKNFEVWRLNKESRTDPAE